MTSNTFERVRQFPVCNSLQSPIRALWNKTSTSVDAGAAERLRPNNIVGYGATTTAMTRSVKKMVGNGFAVGVR